ncbi:hypothetical protein JCM10207_000901 [Rhodosporidiobolus poonsookiae]
MSANFYLSSHANSHLHPRATLLTARHEDLRLATEQELAWIEIWSASAMQKLCKRLGLRQQVHATAIVFFRRFYLRNSYCETDPALVAAACCYVAAKAEETPVHVKSAASEARIVFSDMSHPTATATFDPTKLAEMEFYLLEELDFHLVVYHPYRALVQLCGRDGGAAAGGEEGRKERGRMLEMDDTALQMAWYIINDTFRSSLCLIHPPHLIAIAAIYLAFALHPPPSAASAILPPAVPSPEDLSSASASASPSKSAGAIATRTRRASQDATAGTDGLASAASSAAAKAASSSTTPGGKTDPITFLASLQVDTSLVLEIVQEIVSLYELWAGLEATATASPAAAALGFGGASAGKTGGMGAGGAAAGNKTDERVVLVLKRMQEARMRELREERGRMAAAAAAGQGRRT